MGLHFVGLNTKAIVGKSLKAKIAALFYLKIAVLQCMLLFIKKRPKAVIGVGGYVSAPVILASFLLGIKRFLCEQNLIPGMANKLFGHIAVRVFTSFSQSSTYFPKNKSILTGNPIRQEFFGIERKEVEKPFSILISGGSFGADFLNQQIPLALASIKESCPELKITHQTGPAKLASTLENYQALGLKAHVVPFIDNMPEAFLTHDLLISRAGATVMAEIMASSMPSILVPYRFANAHQKANALALASINGAVLIEEKDNFTKALADTVKELYQHPNLLFSLGQKAKTLAKPEAAVSIVKSIFNHF
jgi:UDP-N-acetylglucosamine--N-acetylmuramyl-(pentapeptide) pyrophosphoryl-undecaprenol N-acetylglucosamine transferase